MTGDVARTFREEVLLQLDAIDAALAALDQVGGFARPEREALDRAVMAMREQVAGVRGMLDDEAR